MLTREHLDRYLEDLLAGRHEACRRAVTAWLDEGVPLRTLYEGVFRDSLYEVGRRWERGEVSIAVEHTATAITEGLLMLVFPRAAAVERSGRRAVVSCAADEFHQVGGRIVADVLEARGWVVRFVGAGSSVEELIRAVRESRPDLLALSVALEGNLPGLLAQVRAVREAAPALPIVVGGQAAQRPGARILADLPGVRCLSSLAELDATLAPRPVAFDAVAQP
jgi:methanogenic corrinoid protein MtbC1